MTSSEKRKARELVGRFAAKPAGGAFPHLKRAAIAEGLLQRIDNPGLIRQGTASLCGPASLLFSYASERPVEYVRFVANLYDLGAATLGKLSIKPGSDLRSYALPQRRKKVQGGSVLIDPEPVDWIALASIRDSENWFFDYQAVSDTASGATLPSVLEGWLQRAGYRKVINKTNVFFTKDDATAKTASDLRDKGYNVALFINADMLDSATQADRSAFPDHWVVLTSKIALAADSVSFTVFTWGYRHWRVPQPTKGGNKLSLKDFLKNFYGFVACQL